MIHTLFTGQHLIQLAETASTNTYAKEYIANNSPIDGTVILADAQLSGRGQSGNVWLSEPGKNLTFSIVYRTDFLPATKQFYLNMAISLGIVEVVKLYCPSLYCSIKWPNDILVGGKKICGILVENTIQGNYLQYSIAGIGLNVNQRYFPEELTQAGSLATFNNEEYALPEVLDVLLQKIEANMLQLRSGAFDSLKERYLRHLFGLGEERTYRDDTGTFTGMIRDLDESGRLLISKQGLLTAYDMKQVTFLP